MNEVFPLYVYKKNRAHYLDMSLFVRDYLNKVNIKFEDTGVCTICDEDYHSYRRDGSQERQYSFICL